MRDLKLTISMISINVSGLSHSKEKAEVVRLVSKARPNSFATRYTLRHKDKYVKNKKMEKDTSC